MKQLRPVPIALAIIAFCCWTAAASACDQNKAQTTNASAASMKAGGASACAGKVSAANAVHMAGAGHSCPAAMAAGCTAAMSASCPMKGATTSARNADMTAACCSAHGEDASAMNAGAEGCTAHGMKNSAMAAGAKGSCAAHGAKASNYTVHADCDGCAEFQACDQQLRDMGAVLQVVPLKNGVMYVYTSDPSKVRTLQAAMAQREDQMAIFASATSGAHLCDGCKQLRGAALSGKLTREVVNIEGGCLSLFTSSDPAVVARIHAMAGVTAARAKI